MKKNRIANTDMLVSAIGLGTVKFGRNSSVKYPTEFDLPDDKTILNCLSTCKDLGINLLDTAPAYGTSEERLGKLLSGQRQDWLICSKAGEEFDGQQSEYIFTPKHIKKSVQRSLQRLQTDYLDIVLIHSNGDDENIIYTHQVFDTLAQLKQQGDIRAYGMSTKTIAGGLLTIQHADVAMITYNLSHTEELEVIQAARQYNKSIFIKKALASGHINKINASLSTRQDPIQASFDFIFQQAGISSVIIGTINTKHIQSNVSAANLAIGKKVIQS